MMGDCKDCEHFYRSGSLTHGSVTFDGECQITDSDPISEDEPRMALAWGKAEIRCLEMLHENDFKPTSVLYVQDTFGCKMWQNAKLYRGFHLTHESPSIPIRTMDWCATHDDYDGAPDTNDGRMFRGSDRASVVEQVDEWYGEQEEKWAEEVR